MSYEPPEDTGLADAIRRDNEAWQQRTVSPIVVPDYSYDQPSAYAGTSNIPAGNLGLIKPLGTTDDTIIQFLVFKRLTPGSDPVTYDWGLEFWSSIMKDGKAFDSDDIDIEGTLNETKTTGWLTIDPSQNPDELFVLLTYDTSTPPVITLAQVKSTGNGGARGGGMWEYLSDGGTPPQYNPAFGRIFLARAYAGTGTNVNVVQLTRGARLLRRTAVQAFDASASNPEPVQFNYPFPI